jgi:hypothetical protein
VSITTSSRPGGVDRGIRPVSIPAPNSMPSRMSELMARLGRRLGLGRPTAARA